MQRRKERRGCVLNTFFDAKGNEPWQAAAWQAEKEERRRKKKVLKKKANGQECESERWWWFFVAREWKDGGREGEAD